MNERIKELAISKGIYDSITDPYDKYKNGDYYGSVMDDLEKFAELIVRECMKVVNDTKKDDVGNADYNYKLGREMGLEVAIGRITQRFEVV